MIAICPLFNLLYSLRRMNFNTYKEIRSLHVKINMLIYNNEQLQTKLIELLNNKEFVEESESELNDESIISVDSAIKIDADEMVDEKIQTGNGVIVDMDENEVIQNDVTGKNVDSANSVPIETLMVEDILYNLLYNVDKSLTTENFVSSTNYSSKNEDGEFINYDDFQQEKKHKSWLNFLY